jgi:hypothetical protein
MLNSIDNPFFPPPPPPPTTTTTTTTTTKTKNKLNSKTTRTADKTQYRTIWRAGQNHTKTENPPVDAIHTITSQHTLHFTCIHSLLSLSLSHLSSLPNFRFSPSHSLHSHSLHSHSLPVCLSVCQSVRQSKISTALIIISSDTPSKRCG